MRRWLYGSQRENGARWPGFLVLLMVFAGCPKPPVESIDAGSDTIDSGTEIDAGIVDAGRPVLNLEIAISMTDGGLVPVPFNARQMELDSAAKIQISANIDLADARIRVIDWADRVVASDDVATHDGGLSYSITFLEPLKSGRSYQLLVDSQSGLNVTDVSGAVHDDVELLLQIRGDVVPEPGSKTKPKSKKKRRF